MVLQRSLEEAAAQSNDLPDVDEVYQSEEEIRLADMFDDTFLTAHTEFKSIDELIAASPSEANAADELGEVSSGMWDEFVSERTDFESETEFVMAARDHWVAKKLDLV